MKIVCIGDSITAGQYLAASDKPWPALLQGFDVVAKGVNGDTSRLMLERFPRDVQEQAPDVVVIQCGHNDCNRWETDRGLPRVSLRAFEANLVEMFSRVRAFDAMPIVCGMIRPRKTPAYGRAVRVYNDGLLDAAFDHQVEVIPLHLDPLPLMDDGIHLNPAGHRVYAQLVQEALVGAQVAA